MSVLEGDYLDVSGRNLSIMLLQVYIGAHFEADAKNGIGSFRRDSTEFDETRK